MTAEVISCPPPDVRLRRRIQFHKEPALSFIESIESPWKGHEAFAMWLVAQLHPKTILDIGFDHGLSTIAFAYKNRGHVFGIDWFEEGTYAAKSFALDCAFRNISNAIRFNYAKNIHLIIGPFSEVSKKWNRMIDVLHIDLAYTYSAVKRHFNNWESYLKPESVILIHNVTARPEETGRFFRELGLPKVLFPQGHGLGVATNDCALLRQIQAKFSEVREF